MAKDKKVNVFELKTKAIPITQELKYKMFKLKPKFKKKK